MYVYQTKFVLVEVKGKMKPPLAASMWIGILFPVRSSYASSTFATC